MYFGAEHLIGFLILVPSAQWYSYLGPADMTAQLASVQNSVMVPYNMLIWLKKSTVLTAIHSLRSSPSGNMTACLRLPLPRVASACFKSSYWWDPSGIFFFGLNVFEERLLKRKLILASPRGRGPRPGRTRRRSGHRRALDGARLSSAAGASRPGSEWGPSRREPAHTAASSEAASRTSQSRNAEPTGSRETNLPRPPAAPPIAASCWASPRPFLSSANQHSAGPQRPAPSSALPSTVPTRDLRPHRLATVLPCRTIPFPEGTLFQPHHLLMDTWVASTHAF